MAVRFRMIFRGATAERKVLEGARQGLRLAAEHVLTESRAVVPIDEGQLQAYSYALVDETDLTAAVTYDTPYAVRQHEEMSYRHAPGRQAKYLEQPLNASRQAVTNLLAAQLRRAMR
jgi:hypothetical protein